LTLDELRQAVVDVRYSHRDLARILLGEREAALAKTLEVQDRAWRKEIADLRREWSHEGPLPKKRGEVDGRTVKNSVNSAAKWGGGTLLAGKVWDVAERLTSEALEQVTWTNMFWMMFSLPPWFVALLATAAGVGIAVGALVLLQKRGMQF